MAWVEGQMTPAAPMNLPLTGFSVVGQDLGPDIKLSLERAHERATLSFSAASARVIPAQAHDPEGVTNPIGRIIARAVVDSDGALEVSFDDGSGVHVEPERLIEAWEIRGPGNFLAVASPA